MMTTTRIVTMTAAALLLAACGGGGDDGASADGAAGAAVASASIEVEAGDLYFDQEQLAAPAGEIEMTLVNVGAAEHDIVIEEADDSLVVFAAPGETATGTIELEAGTYTYYCSIPGHRSAMEGTLEVS
jgi:plastocyanin